MRTPSAARKLGTGNLHDHFFAGRKRTGYILSVYNIMLALLYFRNCMVVAVIQYELTRSNHQGVSPISPLFAVLIYFFVSAAKYVIKIDTAHRQCLREPADNRLTFFSP